MLIKLELELELETVLIELELELGIDFIELLLGVLSVSLMAIAELEATAVETTGVGVTD